MTRINNLGASRRLPPRLTLLASSSKYKFKEERKRILKLSVKKLRSIEDPEAFLSKSVLINNTLKRLQSEVREEKAKKAANVAYSPSPYSFYSIEKAYREEMERMDSSGNGNDSNIVTSALSEQDQHMFEADDEAESDDSKDSHDSNSSGSDSSDSDEESSDSKRSEVTSVVTSSPEDELLSEVYSPSLPPPTQLIASIDDERPATPIPWAKATPTHMDSNSNSIEAVIKTHESCDNELWSEAVRTECWTKPATPTPVSAPPTPVSATPVSATPTTATPSRTTLSTSSTVNTNTWPNVDWPTYTPSTGTPSTGTPSTASSFNPNISAPTCNSHKENLFIATPTSSNVAPPTPVDSKTLSDSKCYSCGQSSLFQSELQSVVFNSLIASLET